MVASASFFDIGTAADYLETCLRHRRAEGLGDVIAGVALRWSLAVHHSIGAVG